jgi:hypothetical protein
MRQVLTLAGCAAMAVCLAQVADGQGPVRRAARGVGEVAAGAARGTAAVAAGTARALTPGVPVQASAGGPANAAWRTQRYNGDWWYYGPNNNWQVYRNNQWAPYVAETFVPNQQYVQSSPGYDAQQTVFIDSGGRAVICQNGQVAFIDGSPLQLVSRSQLNAQGYLIQQGVAQGQVGQQQSIVRGSYAPQGAAQQSTSAAVQGQAPGVSPQTNAAQSTAANAPAPPAAPQASNSTSANAAPANNAAASTAPSGSDNSALNSSSNHSNSSPSNDSSNSSSDNSSSTNPSNSK